MICENCPYGELIQIDSLIWMVLWKKNDVLMARQDGCDLEKENNGKI